MTNQEVRANKMYISKEALRPFSLSPLEMISDIESDSHLSITVNCWFINHFRFVIGTDWVD